MTKNIFGQKYGILAGVGVIAYFLLFYFIDKSMMIGLGVSWSSLVIILIALLLAVVNHRKDNSGVLTFKEGLRTGFMVVVIANVLFHLFFYLLLKFDPELVTILKQQSIDFWMQYVVDDQQKEEFIKGYENFSYGIADVVQGLLRSIIGGFFLALLGAAIFKRTVHTASSSDQILDA